MIHDPRVSKDEWNDWHTAWLVNTAAFYIYLTDLKDKNLFNKKVQVKKWKKGKEIIKTLNHLYYTPYQESSTDDINSCVKKM